MQRTVSSPARAPDSPPCSHRRPLRVGLLASGAATLALLLLPAVHRPHLRLLWNASASVPLGLYAIAPDEQPRVGELVALRPPPALARFMAERRYVEANALIVKPIAAVAGAIVCRTGMHVSIDGRAVATALPHDRIGRPLPLWSGCFRLRSNELFFIAPMRADSFDSRYFGRIDQSRIVGRALPLWTRP